MSAIQSIAKFNNDREAAREEQEEFLEQQEMGEDGKLKGDFSGVQKEFSDQHPEDVVVLPEFGGKYKIVNNVYTPLAKALWKGFKELQGCNPSTILFVLIDEGKKMSCKKPVFMEVGVLSQQWQEILNQMSKRNFTHVIRIYGGNLDKYEQSFEHGLVHLYNEMRKISPDGSLRGYDVQGFTEVVSNLKYGWDKPESILPNLIDAGSWLAMKNRQGTLPFGEDRSGENDEAKKL